MLPLLVLLLFLGIQPSPIHDDVLKDFRVSEIVDTTTTDCTTNSSGGGPMDQTLQLELIDPLKPDEVMAKPTNEHRLVHQDTTDGIRTLVVPVRPPVPDPEPQPPPIVLTPEPDTFAILSMTGVMLLFLLFGRQAGRRFFRRI